MEALSFSVWSKPGVNREGKVDRVEGGVRRVRCRAAAGRKGEGGDGAGSVSVQRPPPPPPPRKGSGVGFGKGEGTLSSSASSSSPKRRNKKSKPEAPSDRSPTIRRLAPSKPAITAFEIDPQSQRIETAFVLSLAFLGFVVLLQGLLLAATGFLPQDWDSFFVAYLYPSFTPTVVVFLVGAVGYGLYKTLGASSTKE